MAVQTITYDDKVYINQNSNIPDINKCNNTDMNEIKSVVNNNATELDTSVSNLSGQLLWTNPSPTSSFSAQTVNLNSSNYDMYEVIFYGSNTKANTFSTGKIPKGENAFLQQVYYSGGVQIRNRDVTYTTDTSYSIGNGTLNNTTNNTQCVPAYIIGYVTGLFN